LKNLIEILVKALVDNTDEVIVEEQETYDAVKYRISVAPEDLGKVIGKEGRIANAIRTVAKAAMTRDRRKVFVDIVP
jgi:predicted RNA-binding protein YlqC (UPF0109 family)